MKYRVIDDGRAYAAAEFSRSGITITKKFRIRDNVHPRTGVDYTDEENREVARNCLLRVAREADRDIAYQLHGDDWRQHCEFRSPFFGNATVDELIGLIEQTTQ